MTGHFWLKLYCEILDDLKVAHMTDHQFRRFIEFLLFAKELDKDGMLGSVQDICWRLRVSQEECETLLAEFAEMNITKNTPDGWVLVHFAKRQERSESAERVAKWRANHKNMPTVTDDVTGNVTVVVLPSTSTSTSTSFKDLNDPNENENPCLSPLSTAFCNATGIPELTGGPQKWVDALSELGKAGVLPIDVETAVKELRDKKYSIVNLRSIVNPAIAAMSKRKGGNGRPIKPPTTAVETPKDWHA